MRFGYIHQTRSGLRLSIDQQLDVMADAKCQRLVIEKPVTGARLPALAAILKNIKDGDVLVVCEFATLSISPRRVRNILRSINARGASLIVLNSGVDTKRSFCHALVCLARYDVQVGMSKEVCREVGLIYSRYFK